jgi:hypothetical protein
VWVRQLWREQPGLHRGYVVDVLTAITVACALILGGRDRTVAVAWRTLNESGGPVVWGSVFALCAIALIAATFMSAPAMTIALWASAMPYGLVGTWFLHAALTEPSASFFAAILCIRAALMHVSRGVAYYSGSMVPA